MITAEDFFANLRKYISFNYLAITLIIVTVK